MATIVLSAVGTALGSSVGGSVFGLSMATIGRAAGATLGRVIDAKLLGAGSAPVETGRVDRFRLMGASEGAAVSHVYGRNRVAGQVIWATQFQENATAQGGGKGGGSQPKTTTFDYSVSLAVALCEGEITRVGRIWADGIEVAPDDLNMRVYAGAVDQLPDPKMEAVEGAGAVPAYRGLAYVVFEDLPLAQFGNRVPQFSFEVMRPDLQSPADTATDMAQLVQGVALIPGTGEYSLATDPVYLSDSFGAQRAANVHTGSGKSDFCASVTALEEELPRCGSALVVVSWFGDDLRCGDCALRPKVEQTAVDAEDMPWRAGGIGRDAAQAVPQSGGSSIYGGTPADASVVQAINDLTARGIDPVFYPFILMEQQIGNGLPDPWGQAEQAAFPWRGRITTSLAPDAPGSPDGTSAAEAEVAAFMGTAQPTDFGIVGDHIVYSGPEDWGYRRFILHYAHLCAMAGGVSAFCIGSEMRSLTQIRGAGGSFPAVEALKVLAAEVRTILGAGCKISYAADWSEYHGYQPSGTADKLFHLDALWSDPNIDFIGIDNYMPLSDWRDGASHADAQWGAIYNLDYLKSNVAGGEGFDWYYASEVDRDAQVRTPITDDAGEPWVWRYKDLQGWWSNPHHNREGGVRATSSTAWMPQSKPIWFTEMGCAAIDKATNQPNKFLDPKSSESALPHYSTGARDDAIQLQYLRAMVGHYAEPAANPTSIVYGGPMVDMARAHVWAWDVRPFPQFPDNLGVWDDGENYARGHWLNGRTSARGLAAVVAEICERSGVTRYDVSQVDGVLTGYQVNEISTGRAALQPLMLTYGLEVSERAGVLHFANRGRKSAGQLSRDTLAQHPELDTEALQVRAPAIEVPGRTQLGFVDAQGDYEIVVSEAIHPEASALQVSRSEFPLVMTQETAQATVRRWSEETRTGQDSLSFAVPPSQAGLAAGDVIEVQTTTTQGSFRIDRIEESGVRLVEATRVSEEMYQPAPYRPIPRKSKRFDAPTPVEAMFLDLPLLTGDEVPHAPYMAMTAQPWPGAISVFGAAQDANYVLQDVVNTRAIVGTTLSELPQSRSGLWDRGLGFDVQLVSGALSGVDPAAVLSGANLIAIGDGTPDGWEVLQFANTEPVAPLTYRLSHLLRGQAGTDGVISGTWPVGSYVVVLDGNVTQMSLPVAARNLPRHLRFGPSKRPVTDNSYRHKVATFRGNGFRPYTVCHLRCDPVGLTTQLNWTRRSRIEGDAWSEGEVPLGEEIESYVVQVRQSDSVLREVTVGTPVWTYEVADRIADGATGLITFAVAQMSTRYGTGPFRTCSVVY